MKTKNMLTGKAEDSKINKLQPRAVGIPRAKQIHDTSGVSRRVRRALARAAK